MTSAPVIFAHHEAVLAIQGGLLVFSGGAGSVLLARWRQLRSLRRATTTKESP